MIGKYVTRDSPEDPLILEVAGTGRENVQNAPCLILIILNVQPCDCSSRLGRNCPPVVYKSQ